MEDRRKPKVRGGDDNRRCETPDHNSTERSGPEGSDRSPDICLQHPHDLSERQRDRRDLKQPVSQLQERKEQKDLYGIHAVIYNLKRGLIQTYGKTDQDAEKCGRAKYREDTNHDSEPYTQRKFFRRETLFQQADQRHNDSFPKESSHSCRL